MQNEEEVIQRISNKRQWPNIKAFRIVKLIRIAEKAYSQNSVDGRISSILIYHQIVEEFLRNLLELSNLYVQAKIWPSRIELKVKDIMMFGQLIQAHNSSIHFEGKKELLNKSKTFNQTRIKYVHKLLAFETTEEVLEASNEIHEIFYSILDLYLKGRDHIEGLLTEIRNQIDWKDFEKQL